MGSLPPIAAELQGYLSANLEKLGDATKQTNSLTVALSAASAEAARLASRMATAMSLSAAARSEDPRSGNARGVNLPAWTDDSEDSRNVHDRGVGLTWQDRQGIRAAARGGRGGGRAGASGEERDLKAALADLDQQARRVFESTRTPLEKFREEMLSLNGLVQSGRIDMDTYGRAVADAQDALKAAGETGSGVFRNLADDMGDMVAGIVQGTSTIKEAFANMAAQIGGDLFSSGLSSLFRGALGGVFGTGLNIPGFANGTRVAPGGLAMVGERGPELVNLPRGASVTPNHRIGGGSVVLNTTINAPNADAAGLAQVRAQLATMEARLPEIVQASLRDPRFRGAM